MAECDETGDLSRMWTHNQTPSDPRGFQIRWPEAARMWLEKLRWGRHKSSMERTNSFTGVQEEQAACTSVCCVVFRASDWQVWECSQRRIHTDGHLLGSVHAGRCQVGPGEKSQECKIKGISRKILTCKTRTLEWPDAIKAAGIYVFCIFPIDRNKLQLTVNDVNVCSDSHLYMYTVIDPIYGLG